MLRNGSSQRRSFSWLNTLERQGSISSSTISLTRSHLHSAHCCPSRPPAVLSFVISESARPSARQVICRSYLTNRIMWFRTCSRRCFSSCQQSIHLSDELTGRARRHRVRNRQRLAGLLLAPSSHVAIALVSDVMHLSSPRGQSHPNKAI